MEPSEAGRFLIWNGACMCTTVTCLSRLTLSFRFPFRVNKMSCIGDEPWFRYQAFNLLWKDTGNEHVIAAYFSSHKALQRGSNFSLNMTTTLHTHKRKLKPQIEFTFGCWCKCKLNCVFFTWSCFVLEILACGSSCGELGREETVE